MSTRRLRLLVLSVSAGAGHVRSAETLDVAAIEQFDADALHLDVTNHVAPAFCVLHTDAYR